MKLFVFVLYVIFNDGTQTRVPITEHLAPAACAELLQKGSGKDYSADPSKVQYYIIACEEEQPAQKTSRLAAK